MAPNYTSFLNPIELKTMKAARVLGKLIATWTLDETSRPADAKPDAYNRILTMSAGSFRAIMDAGVDGVTLDETDYTVRHDITEVELILRTEGKASLLLPEASALAGQEETRGGGGMVPGLKVPVLPGGADGGHDWVGFENGEESATNQIKFSGDNALDEFLYPYMAGYMCSQCI